MMTSQCLQYLNDLRERGVRIIIGEFFETSARNIICEAYKQGMTQRQGYVWFLPAWYQHDWYDTDALREDPGRKAFLPNCTTAEMVEVNHTHPYPRLFLDTTLEHYWARKFR